MTTFLLATHNANKLVEFRRIFETLKEKIGAYELLSFSDIGFDDEVEENGTTFEENALIKARAGAARGYITIADDSGLAVDALGGAPGIYSARFCGRHGDDEGNNRMLLEQLKGKQDRTARYVCAIACVFPDGRSFTVRGTCEGEIIDTPRGTLGFGYDPLFWIPEKGMTFAEMPLDEKNKMSHRSAAAALFAEKIISYIQE
ncbi:MAG: RdgB/HAM1 family non-canonical purine NTP pyrophosphatase [Eubacteriales bacterium]